MTSLAPGMIVCPSCGSGITRHFWFVHKRVRELTCPHCGAQVEVSVPAWPHYTSALLLAFLVEGAGFVLLFLLLTGHWIWPVLVIGAVSFVEFVRSVLLRRWATIRWINQGSMERSAAGRWTPW